jgi:hypothetical protein
MTLIVLYVSSWLPSGKLSVGCFWLFVVKWAVVGASACGSVQCADHSSREGSPPGKEASERPRGPAQQQSPPVVGTHRNSHRMSEPHNFLKAWLSTLSAAALTVSAVALFCTFRHSCCCCCSTWQCQPAQQWRPHLPGALRPLRQPSAQRQRRGCRRCGRQGGRTRPS